MKNFGFAFLIIFYCYPKAIILKKGGGTVNE
jgi:hypothetical protein